MWTAPPPTAKRHRCSSSIFPLRPRRSPNSGSRGLRSRWDSAIPPMATWRSCRRPPAPPWPRISTELFQAFAGIGAPELVALQPSVIAARLQQAPVGGAGFEPGDDARFEAGHAGGGCRRIAPQDALAAD